jgi:hypothetical protein
MSYRHDNGYANGLGRGIGIIAMLTCLFGWRITIAVLLLGYAVMWATVARTKSRAHRERRILEQASCRHGLSGAVVEPYKCEECVAERVAAAEQDRLRRELNEQRLAEEGLRAYQEHVEQVKLPEYLRSMDPRLFEELVCNLFRQMGYRVEATPYVGDGGADGYLYKDGQKTVLQCKRVKGSVGEPVLRDLYGTMHGNGAQFGLVVTTGRVSRPAREWATGKTIKIIELDELRTLLEKNFPSAVLVPPEFAPVSSALPCCPQCRVALRVVRGRRGSFLGCTGYPKCKYTRSMGSKVDRARPQSIKRTQMQS